MVVESVPVVGLSIDFQMIIEQGLDMEEEISEQRIKWEEMNQEPGESLGDLGEHLEASGLQPVFINEATDFGSPEFQKLAKSLQRSAE